MGGNFFKAVANAFHYLHLYPNSPVASAKYSFMSHCFNRDCGIY